ncbi:MAG: hypothetical protein A4E48_00987 [Methanosaeta sp. PtaU1.Bin060]|nr:MAG: hypothetical protein A4E48_00987 [Methanosaeta sp. PtaU1.Bin060]
MSKPSYLLEPVEDIQGTGENSLYRLVQIENDQEREVDSSHVQFQSAERADEGAKVRILIEGKERVPLKVLLRKSDDFGRFSLGKGDKSVTNRNLLVIVLEPIDPDDRIFMEPIK